MMKAIKKENEWICTVLAFMLIPISGFAMDVYVPSFPQMVSDLNTTIGDVRLTLTIFLVSYGLSQLFVGSLVDSFGRYGLSLLALVIFIISNVVIVLTKSIEVIFVMRGIQGVLISIIMIAKRSFFIDIYEGKKQKHYTSLLSIVWSVAPIVAPFLGGYLQSLFDWRANFYFLAGYALIMLLLELVFGGETIKKPKAFQLETIVAIYKKLFKARDFTLGIVVLGLSYAMAIIFGMSAPFIIEQQFHLSAVTTGYCALFSGIALFFGGLLSKYLINQPFYAKIRSANLIQCLIAAFMFLAAGFYHSIFSIMVFVALLHFLMGFIYNVYFTYCLTRFPSDAGVAGGVTSGGAYIVTSIASYSLVSIVDVSGQKTLAICYFVIVVLVGITLLFVPAELRKRIS